MLLLLFASALVATITPRRLPRVRLRLLRPYATPPRLAAESAPRVRSASAAKKRALAQTARRPTNARKLSNFSFTLRKEKTQDIPAPFFLFSQAGIYLCDCYQCGRFGAEAARSQCYRCPSAANGEFGFCRRKIPFGTNQNTYIRQFSVQPWNP